MNSHQGRGAGRIDGHTWTDKIELVGNAIGRDALRLGRPGVSGNIVGVAELPGGVVVGAYADKHPGFAACQFIDVVARPLNDLPRKLKQQSLLRVHDLRLTWADTE